MGLFNPSKVSKLTCTRTITQTHTAVQMWRCFENYDISPSPSSIWVRIWKTLLHTLYFSRLKVPLTALCGGCGVAVVHSHISSQSPLLESPLVALCGQTPSLESQREREVGEKGVRLRKWAKKRVRWETISSKTWKREKKRGRQRRNETNTEKDKNNPDLHGTFWKVEDLFIMAVSCPYKI